MNTIEILLIINSALLSLIGVLFVVVQFFLKDFHRDFKSLVGKVNDLHSEHKTHLTTNGIVRDLLKQEVAGISKRLRKVESKISKQ